MIQVFLGASIKPIAQMQSIELPEEEILDLARGLADLNQGERIIWTRWGATPDGPNLFGRARRWRIVIRRGRYAAL